MDTASYPQKSSNSKKEEWSLIALVSVGSFLEWYEIFIYIFWAPIIEKMSYDVAIPAVDLAHFSITLLLVVSLSRIAGGTWFGYMGDSKGRSTVFWITLIGAAAPILFATFLPQKLVFCSLIFMGIMRFIQGVPAGGELPGALCYLEESSAPNRRRYMCSYLLIGPQIGQMFAFGQCFLIYQLFSEQFVYNWGWRISFAIGGLIGMFGVYFRKKMHESRAFDALEHNKKVLRHPIHTILKEYKFSVLMGIFISIFEVVGFFMIVLYIFPALQDLLGLGFYPTLALNTLALIPVIILMPFIGKLACHYDMDRLLCISTIGIILVTGGLYWGLMINSKVWAIVFLALITLLFTVQFALIPSLLAELFPTKVRFTCLGFSFNFTDSLVGGFVPLMITTFIHLMHNPFAFLLLIPITGVIFLICLYLVRKYAFREHTMKQLT